jgi:hypothetical protein
LTPEQRFWDSTIKLKTSKAQSSEQQTAKGKFIPKFGGEQNTSGQE